MKFGGGALVIAAGLLVLWLAVSGKLSNMSAAWATLNGSKGTDLAVSALPSTAPPSGFPPEAFPTLSLLPDSVA